MIGNITYQQNYQNIDLWNWISRFTVVKKTAGSHSEQLGKLLKILTQAFYNYHNDNSLEVCVFVI